MPGIVLTVTNAGRAALVNAANDGTNAVRIAACGITATAFAAAAGAVALPGEFVRLTTLTGGTTAADTIHLVVRDDGLAAYAMRGFALYLADGTLFALYGQPGPIVEKTATSTMLLAIDVRFADIAATSLTFGDANFLNPVATTEVHGVVELATPAESVAAIDATRAVTPAGLAGVLDGRFGVGAASAFVRTLLTAASAAAFRLLLGLRNAALKDEGHGNGLDADTVDGFHVARPLDYGFTWPALPVVGGNGVMEIGRYLDFHRVSGATTEDFGARLEVSPTGQLALNGGQVWTASNDGPGSGLDADLLDGRDDTAYFRARPEAAAIVSGAIDAVRPPGVYRIDRGGFQSGMIDIGGIGGSSTRLQIEFHYFDTMGFRVARDADTQFDGGGFVPLWAASNDGAGSGLDADVLRGLAPSAGSNGSTIAQRTPEGYLDATYHRQQSPANENPAISQIMVVGGDNDFIRKASITHAAASFASAGGFWTSANDGAGSGLDADRLDGLNATSFLRGDASGFWQLASNTGGGDFNSASLVLREVNFGAAALPGPKLGFHWAGRVASQLALSVDGSLRVLNNPGTGYESFRAGNLYSFDTLVWSAGNDGAGSGLDADVLRGAPPSVTSAANTVVLRSPSGHVFANYFNQSSPIENPGITTFLVTGYGDDGFLRKASPAHVAATLAATGQFWTAANDGTGSGLDADLLDGRDESAFFRARPETLVTAATLDTPRAPGAYPLARGPYTSALLDLGGISGSSPRVQLEFFYGDTVAFRVARDAEGQFDGGGFVPLWAASNDGAGSGLDADVLRGLAPSAGSNGSTIAQRTPEGYLDATYHRQQSPANENPAISQICVMAGDNDFIRKASTAHVAGALAATGQFWTAVNDGAGSGLDADLLDGRNASSFADAAPFADRSLAANGWQMLPGGMLMQWGQVRQTVFTESALAVVFPRAFPGGVASIQCTGYIGVLSNKRDLWVQIQARTLNGFTAYLQADDGDDNMIDGFDWFAVGF